MISQNRSYQIMQGVMSLLLGCISIALLVTLWDSGYPNVILFAFLSVGITLIFSGDYLLNPFKLPVKPIKQEIASDIGLIAYGVLYFSIAMSNLLQAPLVHCGVTRLFTTDLGAARVSRCRDRPDGGRHLRYLSFIRGAIIR